MTLEWVAGAAAVGALSGPAVRAGVLARYDVRPPAGTVEAAAAAALAVTAARAASAWPLAALGWLMLCAVPLVFIDSAVRRLPDPLTGAALAGTLGLFAVAVAEGGTSGPLVRAAVGAAALCGFYLLLFLIRPSGMGLGDVKLAAGIGAGLGWLGWPSLIAGTFLTFLLAAGYGLALVALHRATRTSQLPLGPFIVLGTLIAIAI